MSRMIKQLMVWTLGCVACGVAWAAEPEGAHAPSPTEIRAQLTPRHYTTLSSELGAAVDRLHRREGERFKAGEVLVDLHCDLQQAQLEKARSALAMSERSLVATKRLLELKSIGALEVANAETEAAKNRSEVRIMTVTVSKCAYKAPFDGRVAEQKVREKQFVQAGQPLLEILDDSRLELEFIVPSRWLAWMKPGVAGRVTIHETEQGYPLRLTRIGAKVDPVSQSVKVAGEIEGRFPELISGMSGRVELTPPVP